MLTITEKQLQDLDKEIQNIIDQNKAIEESRKILNKRLGDSTVIQSLMSTLIDETNTLQKKYKINFSISSENKAAYEEIIRALTTFKDKIPEMIEEVKKQESETLKTTHSSIENNESAFFPSQFTENTLFDTSAHIPLEQHISFAEKKESSNQDEQEFEEVNDSVLVGDQNTFSHDMKQVSTVQSLEPNVAETWSLQDINMFITLSWQNIHKILTTPQKNPQSQFDSLKSQINSVFAKISAQNSSLSLSSNQDALTDKQQDLYDLYNSMSLQPQLHDLLRIREKNKDLTDRCDQIDNIINEIYINILKDIRTNVYNVPNEFRDYKIAIGDFSKTLDESYKLLKDNGSVKDFIKTNKDAVTTFDKVLNKLMKDSNKLLWRAPLTKFEKLINFLPIIGTIISLISNRNRANTIQESVSKYKGLITDIQNKWRNNAEPSEQEVSSNSSNSSNSGKKI